MIRRFPVGTAKFVTSRLMSTTQVVAAEPSLITEKSKGGLLHITLNRPKALNALDMTMVQNMNKLLTGTINVPETKVGAFLVKGAGAKAFCAGGDVKTIWQELATLKADASKTAEIGTGKPGYMHTDFFREEYIMNYMLAESLVPQVSIWDGFVMGGGVGVSIFGEFRVASEKAVFAMPETAIGLIPDVGGSSWLPHLKDGVGAYVGLTGVKLNAADLIHNDIATHYISSEKLAEVENTLKIISIPKDPVGSRRAVKDILDAAACVKPEASTSSIVQHLEAIGRCFGKENTTMEAIIAKLEAETEDAEWAQTTLKTLSKMSPTSLKLTLEQLRRGRELDLKGCLRMEYRVVQNIFRQSDFSEGIRALLVDRDNQPKWQPATLAEVTDEAVKEYFTPLGVHDLDVFAKNDRLDAQNDDWKGKVEDTD